MPNPDELTIVCYKEWSGGDVTYQFANRDEYEAMRQFLDGLSVARFGTHWVPTVLPNSTAYFYALGIKDGQAFQNFLQSKAEGKE